MENLNSGRYDFKKFGSVADVDQKELTEAMAGSAQHFRKEYKRVAAKVRYRLKKNSTK